MVYIVIETQTAANSLHPLHRFDLLNGCLLCTEYGENWVAGIAPRALEVDLGQKETTIQVVIRLGVCL